MPNNGKLTAAPVFSRPETKPPTMLPKLLLGVALAMRCALVVLATIFATTPASAQDQSSDSSGDQVWRCSFDGKFYTITNANGVHIHAINSGQMSAEAVFLTDKKGRLKTDRKGNNKLEGRWGSTMYGGLIVIQGIQPDKISGFVLAPTAGIAASSCNSRTAAAILSFGQPAPICNVFNVTWDLQPGVSTAQASAAETVQDASQVNPPAAQPVSFTSSSDPQLVGTWFKEVFDGNARYTTTITLRADGTYTKSLMGRNHSGTWTSSGKSVHLSGDGNYPPTNENLSLFRRVN